ncbi:hypothetical protein EJX00_12800 [Enterococcus faecium]|nr:hypothetical protein [Enterococcus faecium]
MIHKKVFLYSAVVLSVAGLGVGAGKSVVNATETKASISYTAPEKMKYTKIGDEIKGYIRVKRPNGELEYMVTHDFVDSNGNEAYCMDSEKPTPNGHDLALQGKLGDEFYRMYEAGYSKRNDLNGLPVANVQEARYATQIVSWLLSNNFKTSDIVWSTPEHSQAEIDRVHKAFDIIWNHVQNGKTSTDTTYDLKKVNESEDDIYYNYKFKSEANKTEGKASVSFDKEIPGMRILNKDGKEISKDNLPLNQEITIQIPKGTPTGELTITSEGDIKTVHVFKYGGDSSVQPANSLISVDDEHKTENQKISWKLRNIVIGTTATDKADNDKVLAPDTTATIVDEVTYENAIVGEEYTVTGKLMDKETEKPLLIDGKEVTGTTTFIAEKPNGKVPVEITFDTTGLDGKEYVVFESMTANNKEVAVHADINDEGQSIEVGEKKPEIGTIATDKADKDKILANNQKVTVNDEVSYKGLVVGEEYTVTGKLMDKSTEKALLVDGKEVTGTAKFVAKTPDGKVNVEFTFDTTGLENKELVAFESLKVGGKEIAIHADLNDKSQSIKVDKPDTPLPQTGSENYQAKGIIGLALAGVSAFLVSVYSILKSRNTAK